MPPAEEMLTLAQARVGLAADDAHAHYRHAIAAGSAGRPGEADAAAHRCRDRTSPSELKEIGADLARRADLDPALSEMWCRLATVLNGAAPSLK